MMNRITRHALRVAVLSSLVALSGCVIFDGYYDEAARNACDSEIDGKSRVDCYDRADEARRERDWNKE